METVQNEEYERRIIELEALASQLKIRLEANERSERRSENPELPGEIWQELDESTAVELEEKFRVFKRDLQRYQGATWTQPGAVNKRFIGELKRATVEANALVQAKYKDADRVRQAARAAAEIFEDIKNILEQRDNLDVELELQATMEKTRRLAVYGFGTAKKQEREARNIITKALRLPGNLQYMDEEEEANRDMAFDQETILQIDKARYEQRLLRAATTHQRGFNHGYGRGRGHRFERGSYRGRPFFGQHRPQSNFQHNNNNNSLTTNNTDRQ